MTSLTDSLVITRAEERRLMGQRADVYILHCSQFIWTVQCVEFLCDLHNKQAVLSVKCVQFLWF